MQRCVELMSSARRFFTLLRACGHNLVCVYTSKNRENSKSRPRSATLQASLAAGVRGWDHTKIDDSLPGWHLDGICVAAYNLHIALLKS